MITKKQTTYYLSSLDSASFSETRECVFLKEIAFDTGKQAVVAKLAPPAIGQTFGLGGKDIEYVILANRHGDEKLTSAKRFPVFVFITRPLNEGLLDANVIYKSDVEIIAWGEIYRTREAADKHIFDK